MMEVISWITSIILSGVITAWFTFYSLRKKSITNFTRNEYEIGKALSEEFDALKISFNGEPINNDVRIYRGVIMNTGHNDIADGENKITIVLPENCVIKACKIKNGHIDNVKNELDKKNPNKVTISFGLLQENECFEYALIYEVTKDKLDSLSNKIHFQYRIENVNKKMKKAYLSPDDEKDYKFLQKIFIGLLIFICVFFYISYNGTSYEYCDKLNNIPVCEYEKNDSTVVISKDMVSLGWLGEKFLKLGWGGQEISKKKFREHYEFQDVKLVDWSTIITSGIMFLVIFYVFYELRKSIKYSEYIKQGLNN